MGPTFNIGMERGMTSQQQAAAMQQMRNNYMNNQSGHFGNGASQNGQMPANAANVLPNAAAMQRYQQMQNSRQQMLNQMRNSSMASSMAAAANMKNTNAMRLNPVQQPQQQQAQQQQQQQQQPPPCLPPSQASYNQNSVQAQQQAQLALVQASSGAKWHTPQHKQTSHSNSTVMLGMSPPANNFINDSFKIPLRSPDTLRNQNATTNGSTTSFPIPLPNVTSSNPKTPSPSQKDPQKDISDSIDMVCNESVVDLLATIAKLDSNGVQVVPEGRKVTSPQVHSSTDTLDPNAIGLNDKNNQPKDDPNEDWCAVCMGKCAS
jgi:tripartite motif-containing protein 33